MTSTMIEPQSEEWEELVEGRDVLTVEQIADYLQVHPETVRRWLRDGQLRGMALGGRSGWRVRRAELERFMQALEAQKDAAPE
jgi:excisionase family DNA binding protein